jgi:hypothetical protein
LASLLPAMKAWRWHSRSRARYLRWGMDISRPGTVTPSR